MEQFNKTLSFENRELTGITVRSAIWLISGLCSILVTIIMTYTSIINKLDKNQDTISEVKRSNDITGVQIKTLEVQLQTIEIRLVRLETQLKSDSKRE